MKPIRGLEESQLDLLSQLGMHYGVMTSVHYDSSEVRELVAQMGEVVQSERATADLPDWPVGGSSRQVGMNQASFELSMRETQSKGMEVP
jgi:hypothetical protein